MAIVHCRPYDRFIAGIVARGTCTTAQKDVNNERGETERMLYRGMQV